MTRSRARRAASLSAVAEPAPDAHRPAVAEPPAVSNFRQLLTSTEVAAQLRLDVHTVRSMIGRGELPAYRVGREYRVHPDALAAYLAAQAVVPPPSTEPITVLPEGGQPGPVQQTL